MSATVQFRGALLKPVCAIRCGEVSVATLGDVHHDGSSGLWGQGISDRLDSTSDWANSTADHLDFIAYRLDFYPDQPDFYADHRNSIADHQNISADRLDFYADHQNFSADRQDCMDDRLDYVPTMRTSFLPGSYQLSAVSRQQLAIGNPPTPFPRLCAYWSLDRGRNRHVLEWRLALSHGPDGSCYGRGELTNE